MGRSQKVQRLKAVLVLVRILSCGSCVSLMLKVLELVAEALANLTTLKAQELLRHGFAMCICRGRRREESSR